MTTTGCQRRHLLKGFFVKRREQKRRLIRAQDALCSMVLSLFDRLFVEKQYKC